MELITCLPVLLNFVNLTCEVFLEIEFCVCVNLYNCVITVGLNQFLIVFKLVLNLSVTFLCKVTQMRFHCVKL